MMDRLTRALLGCLILLTAAMAQAQNSLPPIKWRTAGEGAQSQITQFERHFLYSEADLQTYSRKAFGSLRPPGTIRVDWNKEMMIAVHLGTRNTGGHSVYVSTIERTTAAAAKVFVVEKRPHPRAPVIQALTSPWVIVAIERPGVTQWDFDRKTITDPLSGLGGRGCGCGCSRCGCGNEMTFGTSPYNPTPFGGYSVDNRSGVRVIGKTPHTLLMKGTNSRLVRAEWFLIQSDDQWADYMERAFGESVYGVPAQMDWRREQVLALHLGRVRTGATIEIEYIQRLFNGTMEVTYSVNEPHGGSSVARSPFVAVRMSRVTEPIVFRELRFRKDGKPASCDCGCKSCGDHD